jgi:hypothetical protein
MTTSSKGYTSSYRGTNVPGAYFQVNPSDFGKLPTPPAALGAAGNYALLAYSGVTNTGSSTINGGNVGSFPTESITGIFQSDGGAGQIIPPYIVDNAGAAQARIDGLAAYTAYAALSFTSLGGALDLSTSNGSGGNTYVPGNYSFGAATMSTGIVLNGAGTYIFKGSSTINLASGQSVTFAGNATAANTTVIWLVGSSFTSVATSNMVGTILAYTSITLGGGTLVGRALAVGGGNGAVTIAAAMVITNPLGSLVPGIQNPLPLVPANGTADYVVVVPNTGAQWKAQKSVQFARPNGATETAGITIDGCDCNAPVYPGISTAVVADYTPAAYMVLNGYLYKATTAGTTASTFIGIKAFNFAKGATTTDGSVVWTSQGRAAIIRVRYANSSLAAATPVAQEYDWFLL